MIGRELKPGSSVFIVAEDENGTPRIIGGVQLENRTATIVKDGTISDAINLSDYVAIGMMLPTLNSGDITFTVCDTEGGSYVALKDKDGAAITIAAGTGGFAVSSEDLAPLAGYRYFKIVCATAQTTSVRTITITVKR
jgi:hypothetical protein